MKPILILDIEYKYYGERLCGECKKPIFNYDEEGYIKDFKYCPHCGMEVENILESDEVVYAKKNYEGYEYFDKTERIRREENLKDNRKKSVISQILMGFHIFFVNNKDLKPSLLKRLQEASKIVSEVAKEMN